MFLFCLTMMGAWMFYGSIIYWMTHCSPRYERDGAWGVLNELVGCSPWVLYMFILAFLHTSWASIAFLVQLFQVSILGLTSSERLNLLQRRRKYQQSFSLRENPYNLGVVRNVLNFFQLRCCGLCKPAVVDWTQQYSSPVQFSSGQGFHTV
ncbi:hypothetical protein GJAV_G00229290 [Gymnothorax javanicus]|nr:hypothetical protein GJAV_G00229290 [Gymnothorax javanicus]